MQDLRARLKALDLVNWTTVFGAELLSSVLPLLILLSSLANERVDDDVSRHIGVNAEGAHIVRGLFRNWVQVLWRGGYAGAGMTPRA